MNVTDFIKDNVYLPYFRRHTARARSQRILLGVGVGAILIAGLVGWWLLCRRDGSCCGGSCDEVKPSGD